MTTPTEIPLYYDCRTTWELDFLTRELFVEEAGRVRVHLVDDILKLPQATPPCPCILVFTSNMTDFPKILALAQRLRPLILVHLSEEWGSRPEYLELSKYTRLLLREYRHWCYPPADARNTLQLPLGYIQGYFEGSPRDLLGDWGVQKSPGLAALESFLGGCGGDPSPHTVAPPVAPPVFSWTSQPPHFPRPVDRPYPWSFLGTLKEDRQDMLDAFQREMPGGYVGANFPPNVMREIYRSSLVVPTGRGNYSLDCLRIYEAIFAGAVAVIVGEPWETEHTFGYDGDACPVVVFRSWNEAARRCREWVQEVREAEKNNRAVESIPKTPVTIERSNPTQGGSEEGDISVVVWQIPEPSPTPEELTSPPQVQSTIPEISKAPGGTQWAQLRLSQASWLKRKILQIRGRIHEVLQGCP